MKIFRSLLLKYKQTHELTQVCYISSASINAKTHPADRMQAWQIHAYGDLGQVKLSSVRTPAITKPTDVLVEIQAASVNPIDVAMIRGYGSKILNLMRKTKNVANDIEFPLIMGRDFSGIVVSKGCDVGEKLQLGDEVWGVIPVEQQGCHADYVTLSHDLVNVRPANLSHVEAASILYTGLTAWSSLWITGGLCYKSVIMTQNRRILILGGSGGVGTSAIQLAKAWNLYVVTTCSTDAIETLNNLGADIVIDYKQPDAHSKVISEGEYDIILDCANQGPDRIRSLGYPCKTYVTLNSPLLRNVDQHGLIGGAVKNFADLLKFNLPVKNNKGCVKWGFFTPSTTGINVIQDLVTKSQLVPVVSHVYSFEELPKAYEKVSQGHLRGKVVIDMKS